LIITCKSGVTIRTGIQDIREAGRATQGVKLIRIDEGDEIAAISQIEEAEDELEVALEGTETTAPDVDAQANADDAASDVQGESDNTITN